MIFQFQTKIFKVERFFRIDIVPVISYFQANENKNSPINKDSTQQ